MAAADQDGCALKLICLLEAADKEASDDEQTVLTFFGSVMSIMLPQIKHRNGIFHNPDLLRESYSAFVGELC